MSFSLAKAHSYPGKDILRKRFAWWHTRNIPALNKTAHWHWDIQGIAWQWFFFDLLESSSRSAPRRWNCELVTFRSCFTWKIKGNWYILFFDLESVCVCVVLNVFIVVSTFLCWLLAATMLSSGPWTMKLGGVDVLFPWQNAALLEASPKDLPFIFPKFPNYLTCWRIWAARASFPLPATCQVEKRGEQEKCKLGPPIFPWSYGACWLY